MSSILYCYLSDQFWTALFAFILVMLLAAFVVQAYQQYRDHLLGQEHQCCPPKELSYRWPLGLDRIKQLWESNAKGHLLDFLCSIAEQYEPQNNLSQYLLLGPRAFHVLHPQNIEALLSTQSHDYGLGLRRAVFAPLLGNGIMTQEGPAWKASRALWSKEFARFRHQSLEHFHEHVDHFLAVLPARGVVDLQPLFFNLTLDITTALLFGRSVYSLRASVEEDEENQLFAESFMIAQEGLAKRYRIAPWHCLYRPRKFRQACADVRRLVERYIKESGVKVGQQNLESPCQGFIDHIAAGSRSEESLRDQLIHILLAGRDTTASSLAWTFRLLVRHPDTFKRLRAEICTVMRGSVIPSRQLIQQMPFLACVIKESLRLYPPVPLNNRTAITTTILPTGGGDDGHSPILVRKGELIVISQYVNSRLKTLFGSDAHMFRPERWENGKHPQSSWAYIPFSGGRRQCLGKDFAIMEMSYIIIRMMQAISSMTLPDGEENGLIGAEKQRVSLVLTSQDGCRVHIRKQAVPA